MSASFTATTSSPSVVFEPARAPLAATRTVRTVTLNNRPSTPQEGRKRDTSSLVLGAVCGLTLGISLLLFGPSPDTTTAQPVAATAGTVVL